MSENLQATVQKNEVPSQTKVAVLITSFAPGGAEKCVLQLLTNLNRQLFDVKLFVLLPEPAANQQSFVELLQKTHIPIYFCNARSYFSLPRVLLELRRELRAYRPNVLQSFLLHANIVAILLGKWLSISQIIVSVRVNEPRRLLRLLERWFYSLAHKIVFVSQSVCQAYRLNLPHKTLVIPNAVITAVNLHVENNTAHVKAPYLLIIGRLHKQKGLDWLLPQLPKLLQDLPYELWIAGEGTQKTHYQQQIAKLKLSDRVQFLGWRADIPQLLAQAKLLLVPSLYEGMSNAVLEAMAAGVPILARNVEGMQELLGTASQHCLVDSPNADSFIQRGRELLAQPHLLAEISDYLQQRAKEHFSIPLMVREYEKLWLSEQDSEF
jgi:glycosyltransferase involved in cell wall biosynthesis